jgi:sulfur carrier protein ThiS
MIQIDLKLFVTLAKYLPEGAQAYEIKEGTCVKDLIQDLGIPSDVVKLIFINGKKKDRHYCIQNRDRVGIFPPVGGG